MATILIGFMGCGKTTVGRQLAQGVSSFFVDLDEEICKTIGMSIDQYFTDFGETRFRALETKILQRYINSRGIISTGGGIILRKSNRKLLSAAPQVVFLQASLSCVWQRIQLDQNIIRPLAKSKKALANLFYQRQHLYLEVANLIIQTDQLSPLEVVKEIQRGLYISKMKR
jgi:shikimate kinase